MKGAEPKSWEAKFGDDLSPWWQAVLLAHRAHSLLTFVDFLGLESPRLGVEGQSKR